jgi:tetratricopeptide (TPR) repeat protein
LLNYISGGDETYQLRFALAKLYKDKPEKAMQVLNEIAVADAEGNAGLKANNLLAIFAMVNEDRPKLSGSGIVRAISVALPHCFVLMYKSANMVNKVVFTSPLACASSSNSLSKCYVMMGTPEKAENMLDGLVAETPDNIAILYLRGALYENMKQPELALQTFEKIIAPINVDRFLSQVSTQISPHRNSPNPLKTQDYQVPQPNHAERLR